MIIWSRIINSELVISNLKNRSLQKKNSILKSLFLLNLIILIYKKFMYSFIVFFDLFVLFQDTFVVYVVVFICYNIFAYSLPLVIIFNDWKLFIFLRVTVLNTIVMNLLLLFFVFRVNTLRFFIWVNLWKFDE